MSASEGDGNEPIDPRVYQEVKYDEYVLFNIVDNLDREKCLREEIAMLKRENHDFRATCRRRNDQIEGLFELIRTNTNEIYRLKRVIDGTKRRRSKYVRRFLPKELIYVSDAEQIKALVFLRKKGWTGKALILEERFARKLSENHIPYIFSDSKNEVSSNCC